MKLGYLLLIALLSTNLWAKEYQGVQAIKEMTLKDRVVTAVMKELEINDLNFMPCSWQIEDYDNYSLKYSLKGVCHDRDYKTPGKGYFTYYLTIKASLGSEEYLKPIDEIKWKRVWVYGIEFIGSCTMGENGEWPENPRCH